MIAILVLCELFKEVGASQSLFGPQALTKTELPTHPTHLITTTSALRPLLMIRRCVGNLFNGFPQLQFHLTDYSRSKVRSSAGTAYLPSNSDHVYIVTS